MIWILKRPARARLVATLTCCLGFTLAGYTQGSSQNANDKVPPGQADKAVLDAAWTDLSAKAKPEKGKAINWKSVADDAKAFVAKYPDSLQARSAAKIEWEMTIHVEDPQPELSASTTQGVTTYLADSANLVRDRIELRIAFERAKLRRKSYSSRADKLQAETTHARALIAEFPDQPEGYGYQLALAKAEVPANARALAQQLLASTATPTNFKTGAQRVLDRLALEGQPLKLDAAKRAVADAQDFSLVVYSWAQKDTGFLDLIKRLAVREDVRFIGINLDDDVKGAKAQAAALNLPGTQVYDGGGFDGPAASQLRLTMTASLYIVDWHGVLRFVNGHQDPASKLTQLALEKGFKP